MAAPLAGARQRLKRPVGCFSILKRAEVSLHSALVCGCREFWRKCRSRRTCSFFIACGVPMPLPAGAQEPCQAPASRMFASFQSCGIRSVRENACEITCIQSNSMISVSQYVVTMNWPCLPGADRIRTEFNCPRRPVVACQRLAGAIRPIRSLQPSLFNHDPGLESLRSTLRAGANACNSAGPLRPRILESD